MQTLKVEDMHCEKCVSRISNAFSREGIAFEISLEDKTVQVDATKVEEALELLDDLGFEGKTIES